MAHAAEARLGAALVVLAAVAWSTAGLFAKGVAADGWAIVFWRSVSTAVFVAFFLVWREGRGALDGVRRLGGPGWAVATVSTLASVAYLWSFKLTSIAHVTIIHTTAPFLAGLFAWAALRERPGRATLAASLAAFAGVAIMVVPAVGGAGLRGDGLALLMTALMALVVVLIRRHPGAPMVTAACVSSLQMTAVGWAAGDPLAASAADIAILAGFGLVQAVAMIAFTEGARRIPAAQAALLTTLDTPLAPLWAWLLLGEAVVGPMIAGGAIVFAAVVGHIWYGRRKQGEG